MISMRYTFSNDICRDALYYLTFEVSKKVWWNCFYHYHIGRYRSTCWMKASALSLHKNLSWLFCFDVTDPQKASISSLNLFDGQALGRLLSMGLQSVTWDVHLLSWLRAIWPVQVHCWLEWRAWLHDLALLLTHSFVLWSCRTHKLLFSSYFCEQLQGDAPRICLVVRYQMHR